jgi:signal transduction histidine kinase
VSAASAYVWWPSFRADNRDLGNPGMAAGHLVGVLALTAVLCAPAVTRATGISAVSVVVLIGAHLVWYLLGSLVLSRGRVGQLRANVMMAGNLCVNVGVATAIPIATHDPRTPLWMLPVLYACINGALQERERSVGFLLAHVLSPLVALLLLGGQPLTSWSIAAPLVCAALCAVSYNHLSGTSARWREIRLEQERALSSVRRRIAMRDRELMMADLSDSVGSTLAVVGIYADMVDEHIARPDALRGLAAQVRDAARGGLGDLRGLLGAMSPGAGTVAGLADTLRQSSARATDGGDLQIVVATNDAASVTLDSAARLAIVRVVQDAIRAAQRGRARRVVVELAADDAVVTLEISDDAVELATEAVRDVRIAERVGDLGGTFSRTAASPCGSIVRVELPRSPRP